jgi:AraC-like DNA-binding protein
MSNVPVVFARSLRKIAKGVAARANARHLLRTVGLDRDAINDASLRIPYSDLMLLSLHAASATKDAAFGLHVGEQVEMREYGVIGQAMLTSSTLGQSLRTLVRYLPIWTDVGAFSLEIDGSVAHFGWAYSHRSLPEARQDCEMSFATVAGLRRLTNGANWRLREVWFQHAKPKDTSEHVRIFGAPLHFGMPANTILLDRPFLDVPLTTANPELHAASTAEADKLLTEVGAEPSFSQCVLSFVRQELMDGRIDLQSAARRLGVSRRTLQRKLEGEDCSYRQLVQQARQELSQYLLRDTHHTATDTAYALGYSEPSAFQHAFHKWHGIPPGAYRRG